MTLVNENSVTFSLENVIPWGRSLSEYQRMFSLTDADQKGTILGCADGPASFNFELTAMGGHVTSCDPLYRFSKSQILHRIDQSYETVVDQARANAHCFKWSREIRNPTALGQLRKSTMGQFLSDFESGLQTKRYVDAQLPCLPFETGSFELALCSHFLFLYSAQCSLDFHIYSIVELCRVAPEVRVFPLLDLAGDHSQHLEPTIEQLRNGGYHASIEAVDYEFQRGGNHMLRINR